MSHSHVVREEVWADVRRQLARAAETGGGSVRFVAWSGEEQEYRLAVAMQAWKLGLCATLEIAQHGRYSITIVDRAQAIPHVKSGTRGRGKKKAADKRRRARVFAAVATYSKRQANPLGRAPVDIVMMIPQMRAFRGVKGWRYKPDTRTRADIYWQGVKK